MSRTFEELKDEMHRALLEGLGRVASAEELEGMQSFLEDIADDLTFYGRQGNAQALSWTLARAKVRGIRQGVIANETFWDVLENAGKIVGSFLGELAAEGIERLTGLELKALLEQVLPAPEESSE